MHASHVLAANGYQLTLWSRDNQAIFCRPGRKAACSLFVDGRLSQGSGAWGHTISSLRTLAGLNGAGALWPGYLTMAKSSSSRFGPRYLLAVSLLCALGWFGVCSVVKQAGNATASSSSGDGVTTNGSGTPPPPPSGRSDVNIDASWKFNRADVAGAEQPVFDDGAWTAVNLPHTWNALDGEDGPRTTPA